MEYVHQNESILYRDAARAIRPSRCANKYKYPVSSLTHSIYVQGQLFYFLIDNFSLLN
jgi:hypothetical protein